MPIDVSVKAEDSAQDRLTTTNTAVEHVDATQIVLSWQHALVRIESGPLFTKLTVNDHPYCFDHVTGRLLQEERV